MSEFPEVGRRSRREPHFLGYQRKWINDNAGLKIIEKSRQIGLTFADAYDSVRKASRKEARFDVWVSSRDEMQARLYLRDCAAWAAWLQRLAQHYGKSLYAKPEKLSAQMLEFANGRRIYSLSSNPNTLAGKRGHVKLDEFALHQDQRLLYRVAKPVITWGGQLSIISTHRGIGTLFNEIITEILHRGNPNG